MIRFNVQLEDNVSPRLQAFGADAPKMMMKVLRRVGSRFRTHTRRNYLRGQMLNRRTGALYKSLRVRGKKRKGFVEVKPYTPLANIYHSSGPIVIKPNSAKALRWFHPQTGEPQFAKRVELRPRPFIPRAYSSFNWNREMQVSTQKIINREVRDRFRRSGA